MNESKQKSLNENSFLGIKIKIAYKHINMIIKNLKLTLSIALKDKHLLILLLKNQVYELTEEKKFPK